jgi:hypothetical protein
MLRQAIWAAIDGSVLKEIPGIKITSVSSNSYFIFESFPFFNTKTRQQMFVT